jgi:hypothetical protein
LFGTLAGEALPQIDLKQGIVDATIEPVQPMQILIGAVIAILLFSVFEKQGEMAKALASARKKVNIGRIIRAAFFMGFFWNEVLGRILF